MASDRTGAPPGATSATVPATVEPHKFAFAKAGSVPNLYRREANGVYYARLNRCRKQFRRSGKTGPILDESKATARVRKRIQSA